MAVIKYRNKDGEWKPLPQIAVAPPSGGGGSVQLVQTPGSSTTEAMSQKAVTDELNKKADASALSSYATKSELNDYATKTELGNYETAAIAGGKYATKTEVSTAVADAHTHSNQGVLDNIKQSDIDKWNSGTGGSGGGESSVTVVQETGGSTDAVMSQKAVTDALAGKQAAGSYALSSDLNNYQPKGEYALKSDLDNYETAATAQGKYATQASVSTAISDAHKHSNQGVLDSITQDQVDKWNTGTGGSGGGESSVTILQGTGESTVAVMSQKAVTDALAGKQAKGDYALSSQLEEYATEQWVKEQGYLTAGFENMKETFTISGGLREGSGTILDTDMAKLMLAFNEAKTISDKGVIPVIIIDNIPVPLIKGNTRMGGDFFSGVSATQDYILTVRLNSSALNYTYRASNDYQDVLESKAFKVAYDQVSKWGKDTYLYSNTSVDVTRKELTHIAVNSGESIAASVVYTAINKIWELGLFPILKIKLNNNEVDFTIISYTEDDFYGFGFNYHGYYTIRVAHNAVYATHLSTSQDILNIINSAGSGGTGGGSSNTVDFGVIEFYDNNNQLIASGKLGDIEIADAADDYGYYTSVNSNMVYGDFEIEKPNK